MDIYDIIRLSRYLIEFWDLLVLRVELNKLTNFKKWKDIS